MRAADVQQEKIGDRIRLNLNMIKTVLAKYSGTSLVVEVGRIEEDEIGVKTLVVEKTE